MDEDRHVAPVADELAQPADVIGVAVGADDPLQLVHPTADAAQVALEHQPRADHAGIDQRQTLLGDEEGVGTEHPHLVYGRRDLHGGRIVEVTRRRASAGRSRSGPR